MKSVVEYTHPILKFGCCLVFLVTESIMKVEEFVNQVSCESLHNAVG